MDWGALATVLGGASDAVVQGRKEQLANRAAAAKDERDTQMANRAMLLQENRFSQDLNNQEFERGMKLRQQDLLEAFQMGQIDQNRLNYELDKLQAENQHQYQMGSLGVQRGELQLRREHPDYFGGPSPNGSLTPRDIAEMRLKFLMDWGGRPQLGETTEGMERTWDLMRRKGQETLPEIFGQPPDTNKITAKYLESIKDDYRFQDRESALANYEEMIAKNPIMARDLDDSTIRKSLNLLPSRRNRRPQTKSGSTEHVGPNF